jgi:uncharacterized protein (DUF4415 family)
MRKDDNVEVKGISPSGSSASAAVSVELSFDSDIVQAFQVRWPDDWQQRMEAAITSAASKL